MFRCFKSASIVNKLCLYVLRNLSVTADVPTPTYCDYSVTILYTQGRCHSSPLPFFILECKQVLKVMKIDIPPERYYVNQKSVGQVPEVEIYICNRPQSG